MALKIPINWVSFNQLGFVQNKKKIESCNGGLVKVRKWECLGMRLVEAERAVEDDKQKQPPLSSDEKIDDKNNITESVKRFHRDLNSLPSKSFFFSFKLHLLYGIFVAFFLYINCVNFMLVN